MRTQQLTLSAILLAVLIVCSQITVPMVPVPITLQSLAVLLIGFLLPPLQGFYVTVTYILLGLVGLPVFSGFKGGPNSILLPSFGFILSFSVAALSSGLYIKKTQRRSNDYVIAGLIATFFIYAIGLPYLGYILNQVMGLEKSISDVIKIGFLPFITGDALKLFVAVKLVPIIHRQSIGTLNSPK